MIHLREDRYLEVSSYGKGNCKLGDGVYTYSRLSGGIHCPGSTFFCEKVCYAKRMQGLDHLNQLYRRNSSNPVPPPPEDARLIRWHVSGDFNTKGYIQQWWEIARLNPRITFWGYTRSWRVQDLYALLMDLRDLKNVHLFASVDPETTLPAPPWKRAYVLPDKRLRPLSKNWMISVDGRKALICPEENGYNLTCEQCKYCFHPTGRDVAFVQHHGE